MLGDVVASEAGWRIASLSYFNPVGAHPSGRIGEDPNGIPNNLFPFISQVAVSRREQVQVFGGDWLTPNGSGVRGYIHVIDLAEGHLATLKALLSGGDQLLQLNLVSGQGHSVLGVIEAFVCACGQAIPYVITERRSGDAAITVADPTEAKRQLRWQTRRNLDGHLPRRLDLAAGQSEWPRLRCNRVKAPSKARLSISPNIPPCPPSPPQPP
jgi:UDP-glucose 4-epimerase